MEIISSCLLPSNNRPKCRYKDFKELQLKGQHDKYKFHKMIWISSWNLITRCYSNLLYRSFITWKRLLFVFAKNLFNFRHNFANIHAIGKTLSFEIKTQLKVYEIVNKHSSGPNYVNEKPVHLGYKLYRFFY